MASFHVLSTEETLAELKSGQKGLTEDEARARLGRSGRNEIREMRRKSVAAMFLGQFADFMIIVLVAAAVVSGAIGEVADTVAILVIVVLNAVLGFVQEYRAERALAALRKMAAANATVIRDGQVRTMPAAELVPGDVVVLDQGRVVPADLRVLAAARLAVDEAALTGESVAVQKQASIITDAGAAFGDRRNMLYRGTVVTSGRGTGVVTATGMETELGRIAALLQTEDEGKTPLQKRLVHFGKGITLAVLAVCAVVFLGGLLRGEPAVSIFLVAVSLAVAAIPEALPAVVTISLALGARKMATQNALVRKLPAVETLGSVTYICTDKTGTITENRMTVEEMWCDERTEKRQGDAETEGPEGQDVDSVPDEFSFSLAAASPRQLLLTALALSNDAQLDAAGRVVGDPTETALYSFARENNADKRQAAQVFPRVAELPFDPDRRLMTTFHDCRAAGHPSSLVPGHYVSFTKGAVEAVLARAGTLLTREGAAALDKDRIRVAADLMAADGLRVLAVAFRAWDELPGLGHDEAEQNLILLGLVGMIDPPREEARQAVTACLSAGIVPVMITGDHPLTATAIARRVGILDTDDPKAVITGTELAALPAGRFSERVETVRVYARVAPEQKLTIVRALQDRGHFVAMTGDGVNDAPALKRADIGVAMGVSGTDVAKETASLILLDDNFATIVHAVQEGRKIYDNIRKVVRYLLSSNSGEIWTLFLAPFLSLPLPLQPIHILWINLLTDGLPALALAAEPGECHVMARPPRRPTESLFSGGLGTYTIWVGLLMAAITLSVQAWAIHVNDGHWQTMVFTTLCFLQLGNVMAIRSERESLFQQGLLSNPVMLWCIAATVTLQLITIYVPPLHAVFKTQPLTLGELAAVIGVSLLVLIAAEIDKAVRRRRSKKP